ncbi:MAG: thiosulfate/3-mercaptopyruvate sulfurtransferase, partial [Chloroflexota bacterium]|nr:thiosulfate/3-mercaptopyruvate sulfurtransferase [Chloroflexota bacterium]
MSGLARPEILATTEWLAENLGRFGVRVLDLRWRPDGTAPAVHATGHIPGAVLVDWRADLVDDAENGEAIFLAGPDRMAALAIRAGIADDTTVIVYDDTQSLFASRAWWSLRAYGFEAVRVLDGGFPDWVAEGREVSNAMVAPGTAGFTVRGPNRMRLTTADVRGLLGSPDVTLLDARAPAEYHGFEGNTKRLGHIPG